MAEDVTPAPAAQEPTAPAPAEQNPKPADESGGNTPLIEPGAETPEGDAPLIDASEEPEQKPETKPEGAPETYADFELPEGFVLDDARRGDATTLFKELNLSQAQAQKAISLYCKMTQQAQTEQENAWMERRKQWRSDIQARPDFREQQAMARKGVRLLLKTEAQRKLFTGSWLQDSPELFDLFVTAGSLATEDGMGTRTQGAQKTETEINMERFPGL